MENRKLISVRFDNRSKNAETLILDVTYAPQNIAYL